MFFDWSVKVNVHLNRRRRGLICSMVQYGICLNNIKPVNWLGYRAKCEMGNLLEIMQGIYVQWEGGKLKVEQVGRLDILFS